MTTTTTTMMITTTMMTTTTMMITTTMMTTMTMMITTTMMTTTTMMITTTMMTTTTMMITTTDNDDDNDMTMMTATAFMRKPLKIQHSVSLYLLYSCNGNVFLQTSFVSLLINKNHSYRSPTDGPSISTYLLSSPFP